MKGYRKVGFALIVVLLATGVLIFHLLTGEFYVSLMKTVIIAYLTANSVQAIGEKVAGKIEVVPKAKYDTPH